jgi:hypothetical protein
MKHILTTLALVVVAVLGAAPAASADSPSQVIYHPGGGKGWANSDHGWHWMVTCDTQADGHFVRSHFTYYGSTIYVGTATEGGCVTDWLASRRMYMRVCVEAEGCTSWRYVG